MLSAFLLHLNTLRDHEVFDGPWRILREANIAALRRDVDAAEKALEEVRHSEIPEVKFARGLVRSRLLTLRGARDSAEEVLHTIRPILKSLADDAVAAWEHRFGVVKRLAGKIDEAIQLQLSARLRYEEMQRDLDAAFCRVEIASALLGRGDVGSATREYLGVLDLIQLSGTSLQVVAVKANLAVAMQRAGDSERAMKLYIDLLELEPYNTPSSERAVILQNMAALAKIAGRYDDAIQYYNEAMVCLTDPMHSERVQRIQCGLGDLALRKGDVQRVREIVDQLDDVDIQQLYPPTAIELASLRFRLAIADGDTLRAEGTLDSARKIAAEHQLREEHAELLSDAVGVLHDSTLRMPLVEELLEIQTERLRSVSSTIATMVNIRARYEQERAAQERARQQERAQVIMETQERTMEEIGRDLHDSIGNDLTVARRRIELLQQDLSDLSDVQKARFDELLRSVEQASSDARRISHMLAAPGLDGAPIETAVVDLLESAATSAPEISFTYAVSGNTKRVPSSYVRTVYRCLQSLLHNMMRHAQATMCEVRIGVHQDELVVAIDDNGCGFDPKLVVRGLGLRSVQARVAAHDGRMMVDSSPGRGAFVSLHLPLGHTGEGNASTDSDLSHR